MVGDRLHRLLLVFLLSALSAAEIWAQAQHLYADKQRELQQPGKHVAGGRHLSGTHAYDGPQPFDMLHYKLDLTLPMSTNALYGTCTMRLRLKAAVDSLVLNAVGLALDTVLVDGTPKSIRLNASAETFTIHLAGVRQTAETLLVEVAYRLDRSVARPSSRQGYYHFSVDSVEGLPANLGYTMSAPSDARFWMPCYDEPWDKATAEMNITVPGGYTAASNGKLVAVTKNADGTQTWRWRENNQIAPYLMCVTSSVFAVVSIPYVRAAGDTIPVEYYVWNRESFRDSASAAAYLPTVRRMIDAFSQVYGQYPFDKYGMTTVIPFGFGGMEHQTLTTMNKYLFTDDDVVSHELAHQWWGDLVTCGTWPDIWLNESFASYSEAIWQEYLGGSLALRNYMRDSLTNFDFFSWSGAVYDPESQGFGLFDRVVYSKGAWVLHTLRGVVGDSTFFRSLREYRNRYAGKNAVTDEFVSAVNSVSGQNMGWFFNQWVFGHGWPQYALRYTWATDTLSLTIYQRQNQSWPTFKMPIQVRAYHAKDSSTFIVRDSLRTQQFKVPLTFPPDSVVLDPDRWILKEIVQPPNSVANESVPVSYFLSQNYPNPFNPATTIEYRAPSRGYVSLKVYDLLGREVITLVSGVVPPGNHQVTFDGSSLSSGVYICRLQVQALSEHVEGAVLSRKMIIAK